MQIKDLLLEANKQLSLMSDVSRLESEILLAYCLNKPRSFVVAWPEFIVEDLQIQAFFTLIARRLQGEPIAYLIGEKEFWSLCLKVTRDTLIPRADTELLVELALTQLENIKEPVVLDLGTGTGAIALAIAHENPQAKIVATDKSEAALDCAKENAKNIGIKNISFVISDWFSDIKRSSLFDVIVSNPPYIASDDPNMCEYVSAYEPHAALIAKEKGYADLFHLIEQASTYLKPTGMLLLEHGFQQGENLRSYFDKNGYTAVKTYCDLAGKERVTVGRRRYFVQ